MATAYSPVSTEVLARRDRWPATWQSTESIGELSRLEGTARGASRPSLAPVEQHIVVQAQAPLPAWCRPVLESMDVLLLLQENWDSYGGVPTRRDLLNRALQVLEDVMSEDSPPPAVVPLTDGGLQLEWHRKKQDLEIVIPADDAPRFYYFDARSGSEEEGLVASGYARLQDLISQLT